MVGRGALWLLAACPILGGCALRDTGGADIRSGTVDPSALCAPAQLASAERNSVGAACPACSAPSENGCQDQFYESARLCDGSNACAGGAACVQGYCVAHDADGDGLDDDLEAEVAKRNFPTLYQANGEHCGGPLGVVYRVRRHPDAPDRLAVTYSVLYDRDCGSVNGHLGDNEAFAITDDLGARPGAAATVGVLTDAHRGTVCDSTSACETRAGTSACGKPVGAGGAPEVVVFSSQDKHANYLALGTCEQNCFDSCSAGEKLDNLPMLNAGEPDRPLITDLSTCPGAFVTAANGWEAGLLDANPWSATDFGGAGSIGGELRDMLAPAGL
jgi:hypothetical protein